MQNFIREQDKPIFNDYTIYNNPNLKTLGQQKSLSTGSITFQNNFNRKKLTVTSRDNSINKQSVKDEYLLQNYNANSQNLRERDISHYTNRSNNTISTNKVNQNQSISTIEPKNRLKLSTSPMTPTKILKLKRSLIKDKSENAQVNSSQRNIYSKLSSRNSSPYKLHLSSHKKTFTQQILINQPQINHLYRNSKYENLKNQFYQILSTKINNFNNKINYQTQLINSLSRKIEQNRQIIYQRQKTIQELKRNITLNNHLNIYQNNHLNIHQNLDKHDKSESILNSGNNYILKRIKDLQGKMSVFQKIIKQNISNKEQCLNTKVHTMQNSLVKLTSYKINCLKNQLSLFINQKSDLMSHLSQKMQYLDNKMIGRSQVLKQTVSQLKIKVKQMQDCWTKDTTNNCEDESETPISSTKNIKAFNLKLKHLTQLNSKDSSPSFQKIQDSLNYSLTSYDQNHTSKYDSNNLLKQAHNIYFDQNLNDMSDIAIELQKNKADNSRLNDYSKLTDDFYYPNNTSSRLANNKKQFQQYNKFQANSFKKISPQLVLQSPYKKQPQSNQTSHISIVKIDSQTINKKIQVIKQLIKTRKQQYQQGGLRCFLDKSGYLKYIDSKTFVFDPKGNLIPCTQGQFWFLITKNLIQTKSNSDQSLTY